MKLVRVVMLDDEGKELELEVQDGTALLLCEENQIFTQVTTNAGINLELIKTLLNNKQ